MTNDGQLVSLRFPYLPVRVSAPGIRLEGIALIDTGLEGGVVLPLSYLPAMGNEPIVGVEVIRHFSVILDHGRRVIVEP